MIDSPKRSNWLGLSLGLFLLGQISTGFAGGTVLPKTTWLTSQNGGGMEVKGTFERREGKIYMDLTLANRTAEPLSDLALQLNGNNTFAISAGMVQIPSPIPAGSSVPFLLPLQFNGSTQLTEPPNKLQVAIKNNKGVHVFDCLLTPHALFQEDGKMTNSGFADTWRDLPVGSVVRFEVANAKNRSADSIQALLAYNRVFTLSRRTVNGEEVLYQSMRMPSDIEVLAELKVRPGASSVQVQVKTAAAAVVPLVKQAYEDLLRH